MNFKQRAFDFLNIEWGTYVERFHRLSPEEAARRLKDQGYESLRDMVAHVLAWWEEVNPVILAIAENREYPRKKYDFDSFNAEAVQKFKAWSEDEFFAYFEAARNKTIEDFKGISDEAWESPRLQRWFYSVYIHHAREHLVALSRFIALDILENDWAKYPNEVKTLEDLPAYLEKQGVASFQELLGHMIGWWEEGARITRGILYTPGFTWQDPATDEFNDALKARFANHTEDDALALYESARKDMADLIKTMPDSAFEHDAIEAWLMADIVGHYEGHYPG